VTTETIAQREGCSEHPIRLNLDLAFLAPEIVQAAAEGTLLHGAYLSQMLDLLLGWKEQRKGVFV